MNRLLAVAFILFCFEIGLFLVFVPWSGLWEHNVLLTYSIYLRGILLNTPSLQPQIRDALNMQKPATVFWSVLENGKLALLNFSNHPATVRLASGKQITLAAYEMAME